jgi:hypothetical protein
MARLYRVVYNCDRQKRPETAAVVVRRSCWSRLFYSLPCIAAGGVSMAVCLLWWSCGKRKQFSGGLWLFLSIVRIISYSVGRSSCWIYELYCVKERSVWFYSFWWHMAHLNRYEDTEVIQVSGPCYYTFMKILWQFVMFEGWDICGIYNIFELEKPQYLRDMPSTSVCRTEYEPRSGVKCVFEFYPQNLIGLVVIRDFIWRKIDGWLLGCCAM